MKLVNLTATRDFKNIHALLQHSVNADLLPVPTTDREVIAVVLLLSCRFVQALHCLLQDYKMSSA